MTWKRTLSILRVFRSGPRFPGSRHRSGLQVGQPVMEACNLITGHMRSVLLPNSRCEIKLRRIRQVCYADCRAEPWIQKDTAALQTSGCLQTPSKQRADHPVFLLWTWRCVAVFRGIRRIWTQSYADVGGVSDTDSAFRQDLRCPMRKVWCLPWIAAQNFGV
jgi:hypothetical protein